MNQTLHHPTDKQKRHTAWQTVPIEQKIEGKCYSVCLSELSVPACSDLQTNHRVKLGFLCACVFVCVRACASMFAWGGGHEEGKAISNCPISKCFSTQVSLPPFQPGDSSTANTNRLTTLNCRWQRKGFLRKLKKALGCFLFPSILSSNKGGIVFKLKTVACSEVLQKCVLAQGFSKKEGE